MKKQIPVALKAALAALACGLGLPSAHAGAVIINPAGTVALGVNDLGHLNFSGGIKPVNASATGLSIIDGGVLRDSTAPGCLCEGWGVSGGGATGYANVAGGTSGLVLDSFTSTATTATSSVHLSGLPDLSVVQAYFPAPEAPGVLFQDSVTITNNSLATISDVRYVRVMDWDVPPTEFSELVTIKGTATTTLLAVSHNDGFETSNPLALTSPITASTLNSDFTDVGPNDHGAYFRFDFGDLAAGESFTFSVYYGASKSEASMLAALGAVGIELYSLGQARPPSGDPVAGTPYTFAFGFEGVGGDPILPDPGLTPIPEPSTYGAMGAALLIGAVLVRRRRQPAATLAAA